MGKIKVIVFDFDGTLYSVDDLSVMWQEYCNKCIRTMFSELSDAEYNKLLFNENFKKITFNNAISLLKKHDKMEKLFEYRNKTNLEIDISKTMAFSNEELNKFARKYTLYIVTNNVQKGIEDISNQLGLDLTKFKKIYINDYKHGVGKEWYYKEIIKKEKIKPEELFVIGDDIETDIKPAIKLGGSGVCVKDCNFTMEELGL